ncbi:ComEA family DNA-binding protein [Streptomyces sp. RCPT1-4]|nr:ComEA family DNA-binding protein [Streptomyces sennicomposti]MBY8866367.1 ComEA family DNA-binding protein [Streptomyces sennicomposti]
MALRSRSRTATATSGPGRVPGSDGRTRHRRPPGGRGDGRGAEGAFGRRAGRRDAGGRHASAEDLRRRAHVLFAEHPEAAGESDTEVGEPTADRPWAGAAGEHNPAPAGADHSFTRADENRGRGAMTDPPPPRAAPATPAAPAVSTAAMASAAQALPAWRERAGAALRDRMPLWLQTRCALERRNVVALTVVLAVAAAVALQHFWTGRTETVRAPEAVRAVAPYPSREPGGRTGGKTDGETEPGGSASQPSTGAAGGTAPSGPEIVVDVSGKVRRPGIHRLPAGSRVVDALRAAGGTRPGTDLGGLNRARFLVDGEQVVVGGPALAAGPAVTGTAAGGASGSGGAAGPAAPVSLSTATVDQLETLPGVGPVLAQHIVDYRTRHGGFRSVDQLREVNGIGDRRFADLRPLVRP